MRRTRIAPIIALVAGVLLLLLAALYVLEPASSLPSVLPGHVGATDPEHAHHHVKHAIAAFALGLAALAYAWFNTGPAARAAVGPPAS
jgi:UDP-N-acetylmuramyl pentapeptide phosphotransferase/UDP-N-acetylglucosamine-1-phosphate transferase